MIAGAALASTQASALYVDFADFQGAESGNQASIEADGVSISITSNPSNFDLSISNSGLGVQCAGGFWACLGNQSNQIDAEWNESIVITFNDGPVVLNSVDLSRFHAREVALISTAGEGTAVRGSGFSERTGGRTVDLGGIVTDQLVVTTLGWFSDASLRGLDFDLIDSQPSTPVRPTDPQPTTPIPEPTAAMLFGAGLVATRLRRS